MLKIRPGLTYWLAYLSLLATTVLSISRGLNGVSAIGVFENYPNLFVPAGFTLIIAIPICLLLLANVIFSSWLMGQEALAAGPVGLLVRRIRPLFVASCLLNASWLVAWHFGFIGISLLLMAALLLMLIAIFNRISQSENTCPLNYVQHVTLETPFIIYFATITLMLMVNASAFFASLGWHGAPLENWHWAVLLILALTAIGAWLSLYWRRPAYTAVILWGLFGIYSGQAPETPVVAKAAIAGMVVCAICAGLGFWQKRALVLHNIQPARSNRSLKS